MANRRQKRNNKRRNQGFVNQQPNQQIQPQRPLPPTGIVKPQAGLKTIASVCQVQFCDLLRIDSTGGQFIFTYGANGATSTGTVSNYSNDVPKNFDKYCGLYQLYTVLQVEAAWVPYLYSSYQELSVTGPLTASVPPLLSTIQADGTIPGNEREFFNNGMGMITPGYHCHNRTLDVQKMLQLNELQPLLKTNGSAGARDQWAQPPDIVFAGFSAAPGNNVAGYFQTRYLVRFEQLS